MRSPAPCLILMLFWVVLASAQQPVQKDSARIYRGIEQYAKKKGKFVQTLHKFIFKPVQTKKSLTKKKEVIQTQDFGPFHGKILRNINIETYDPFGYSEKDDRKPKRWLERAGNNLHVKSKHFAIRNFLLIKKNRPLDSLLVVESERLVRAQRFVRSVKITPVSAGKDSVDVTIKVIDAWSLVPDATFSSSGAYVRVIERNFFGLGHQAENAYRKRFDTGDDGYMARYTVPNILNTYIRSTLYYEYEVNHHYEKYVNLERNFFSPFTRWAGGVNIGRRFWTDSIQNPSQSYTTHNFKYNSHDFWGGYSHQIFKGDSEADRTTNLIGALRFLNVNYTEMPDFTYDPDGFYRDENFYLASVGLSSRQFFQDKYIFNYGITEDVPIGRVFAVTVGRQYKNRQWSTYLGGRASAGKFYPFGYLSGNVELGTFYRNQNPRRTAFTFQANYFTNLLEWGDWKFRQFVKGRWVWGQDRDNAQDDFVNINDQNGIPGFNAREFYGTQKAVLTLQLQGYSPWNLAGFRINPYMAYSAGLLGNETRSVFDSRLFSQLGVGVIISNDYLVFSQFQLSFAYYPTVPGTGNNLIRTNAFNTQDFGFQDFEMGKPRTVDYQ